jgi:hypothetical protein
MSLVASKISRRQQELRTLSMYTLPLGSDARTPPDRSCTEEKLRERKPQELEALLHQPRQLPDDELELIDIRYQQLLARMQLEELFSEAQMGCTSMRRQPNSRS